MLQIIFLNIGLCVILLAIAFVFKKYARVILWSSAITLFVGTLLLVGLGIVNPVTSYFLADYNDRPYDREPVFHSF